MSGTDRDHEDEAPGAGAPAQRIAARVEAEMLRLLADRPGPGLYLVATPIGNLGDITLRALSVLAGAGVVYCEDTRHSRTLFDRFGIERKLRAYHEHNAAEERPRVLEALERGERVALISDAGTPLVSDPGYKLVREALEAGHRVFSIPGASAPLTALTAAGLPTDTFLFAGFLPPKQGQRRTRLSELAAVPATLIFFEAPTRVGATLADLAAVLGAREAAVARELTKLHEEMRRGTLAELAAAYAEAEVKGEIVIVVAPPGAAEVTDGMIEETLREALASMSLRDAAKAVADRLGVAKSRVYDLGLAAKRGVDG